MDISQSTSTSRALRPATTRKWSAWLCGGAVLLLLLAGTSASAQTPGSGGPTPGAPEPTAVPLDGGASLLLLAGTGIALRKLRRRRA